MPRGFILVGWTDQGSRATKDAPDRFEAAKPENRRAGIVSEDTGCAERFLCAVFATVVKPISNLRLLISGSCALLLALCSMPLAPHFPAEAQQPKKVPRIGFLSGSPPSSIKARTEAFRQGLRDLGYVEGKNIVIEWRSAEGKRDRLPALATELVRLKVDVIVTAGPLVTRSVKHATSTIPIVLTQDPNPVRNGFVASLARPGGNITGLSRIAPELSGKQLELLKEIVPRLSRVAVFGTSTRPGNAQTLREVELAAGAFGVNLQFLDILTPKDIETAFRAAVKEEADGAIWIATGSIGNPHRKKIVDLAVSGRLPVIYYEAEFVEAGGLVSYGVNFPDLDRRAAVYVHKILKGAKPADLPVEQPTNFEFVVNLKTAERIGLTIPPNVLVRAQRVIR